MTVVEAIILGFVQGVTEFLPISSSGHLVLLQDHMGIVDPSVFFEVFLHFATLLAIVVFFWRRLLKLSRHELMLLAVASIPAGLVGILWSTQLGALFSNVLMVGVLLLVSGAINFAIDRQFKTTPVADQSTGLATATAGNAMVIGLYQMIALLPGISRSGATVFAGLSQNFSRLAAFEFSFLMAIPVILGANFVEIIRLDGSTVNGFNILALTLGFLTAFFVGLASLWTLKLVIEKAKFEYFAAYCWLVGGGVIVLSLAGAI